MNVTKPVNQKAWLLVLPVLYRLFHRDADAHGRLRVRRPEHHRGSGSQHVRVRSHQLGWERQRVRDEAIPLYVAA